MVAKKAPAKKAEPHVEAAPPVVPAAVPAPSNLIENCIPGTELSLGDGRKLAFGESAEVSDDLAAFLRERGQAK